MKKWLNFLGYGIADLYMSVNGGGETHIYRFDTKTNALRADLDSIDHLTFEKRSRVVFSFNNYLDKDRINIQGLVYFVFAQNLNFLHVGSI